jgi:hypothetical protein
MRSIDPRIQFHPPLEGEAKAAFGGRQFLTPKRSVGYARMIMSDRGGVTLSSTAHPTPSRIPLRVMLADPPPPGEGGTFAAATVQPELLIT